MEYKILPVGIYDANCYIIRDEESGESIIIDAGGDSDIIEHHIKEMNIKPKYILLTHGHADHVGAVEHLSSIYKVPVAISKQDLDIMNLDVYIYGKLESLNNLILLEEDTDLAIGSKSIRVINTPGHTPGGVCFLIEDMLFTGDTLFRGSIGRTDFYGGDFDILIKSIKNKIMILPDNIKVLPGHGEKSTIGYERDNNPFLTY